MNAQGTLVEGFPHKAARYFFLLTAITYMVGAMTFGNQGIAAMSLVNIVLGLLAGILSMDPKQVRSLPGVMLGMGLFAFSNIAISTEPGESALRWLVWLGMLAALAFLASRTGPGVEVGMARFLPGSMILIWLTLYLVSSFGLGSAVDEVSLKHLSGFYAMMALGYAMFHPSGWVRLLVVAMGLVGVLLSGSRALMLLLPLVFVCPAIYHVKNKSVLLAALVLPFGALAAIFLNDDLAAITFGAKAARRGVDAIEAARGSADFRAHLRAVGYEMILARPQGYGYGDTYQIPITFRKNFGTNFHNGLVNVGAAMGVHFLVAYVVFHGWLVWRLVRDRSTSRLLRFLTLSTVMCVCIRAVSEDFTLFDLGTPVCYVLIYQIFLFLNSRKGAGQAVVA